MKKMMHAGMKKGNAQLGFGAELGLWFGTELGLGFALSSG
jgi:hypothetical protein